MFTITRRTGLALTALAALASAAHAAPPRPAVSPLASARTIQVTETLLIPDKTGQMRPRETLAVKIVRPDKAWVEGKAVAGAGAPPKDTMYVSDGTTQYEYNGRTNKYARSDAPKPGETADVSLTDAYQVADVPLLLAGKDLLEGTSRTPAKLDGKSMLLVAKSFSAGGGRTATQKLWKDARTGLPYRQSLFLTASGKTRELQRLDYANWTLNRPVAASQFAWAPPADATEFHKPQLLAVGTPAPDFTATAPDGTAVRLSDLKGKPVILDFWSTWCGPCQMSMPHLEKVYQQVKDKDVAVLGVCVWDDKAAYDKWTKANLGTKYTFPVAFDPAGQDNDTSIASHLYGVSGIPTQYVIDKDGKVAAANVGYDEGDTRLEVALNKLGVDIPVPPKKTASR